ncbi:fungal-specific transcription factor domain-containing protein [Cerioporus squamosus]|nr:fungal-specific transcription factor domain-containing protein [Cerioporus squamosus]
MSSTQDHQLNLSYSEDDGDGSNEPGSSKQAGVKRGTRACDRCRKIKSKCEPGSGTADDKCKNCEVANTRAASTPPGPSFKRGPPKGYIHSIEQRWHQVECILATVMESPRAQDIIKDLRSDAFASAILDRVQAGPYGSRNRLQRLEPNSESYYASLIEVPNHAPARDDRRSRRQSRVSREIVSQDPTASATPTREWQDQLARRLAQGSQWGYASTPLSPMSPSSTSTSSNEYARTRRRLDWPLPNMPLQQNWDNLYTLPDSNRLDPNDPAYRSYSTSNSENSLEPSNVDETAEAFGHLSIDQNKEFRYHGPASGLPLLAQSHRKAGDDQQEHRIWKFTHNTDPEVPGYDMTEEEEDVEVQMPPPEMRHYLLQLYFTYVHPFFPVVHKQDFLHHYKALTRSVSPPTTAQIPMKQRPMQRPCKMLLLAMFAIAARYSSRPEDHTTVGDDDISRAGQQYAIDAHKLLDRKYQSSRPSTCQALLLLAIREFGMGAMDKGWLYSGMNRNADSWTVDGTQPIFTDVEKQIRKHIWWSCCTSDKLSAVWLGRPITFRANDYSTPIPSTDEMDEGELWQPFPPGILGDYTPQPGRLMSTFREACHLSVIITDIMDKIYPVQSSSDVPRRKLFEQLESRLSKWMIDLPEHLRFSANDKHASVLPHVLMLHIEYQAAVLLLHRAFLPPYDENSPLPQGNPQTDPLALKAFDICCGAAVQISSMAEMYNERFGLERAPPFLCIYLQIARRPWDPQATLGLARCITACKHLEKLWPTASRLRTLLEGAKVRLDQSAYPVDGQGGRNKRSVEDALGSSKNPDVAGHVHDMYQMPILDGYRGTGQSSGAWDHARMLPHTLGVAPTADTSTSFYPGYQWWPNQLLTTEGLTHMALSAPMDVPGVTAPMSYSTIAGYTEHIPHTSATHVQPSAHAQTQEPFTFGANQMSQDFLQGVNYSEYDYRRYQEHQGDPRHGGQSRRQ